MEVSHLLQVGHADSSESSYDLLSEGELGELRAELAERLARKRPPGFAPWPIAPPSDGQ